MILTHPVVVGFDSILESSVILYSTEDKLPTGIGILILPPFKSPTTPASKVTSELGFAKSIAKEGESADPSIELIDPSFETILITPLALS